MHKLEDLWNRMENKTKDDRMDLYNELVSGFECELISAYDLNEMGFFTAPASTKYHGAYEGGLFDHSFAVYQQLKLLTQRNGLAWQLDTSPFVVGMYHDLCKCDQYLKIELPTGLEYEQPQWEYNKDTMLSGHGDKSVLLLCQHMSLTEEEVLCIRFHMGAYQTDDWAQFDRAIRKYPNVLWTHMADMLASKVDDV